MEQGSQGTIDLILQEKIIAIVRGVAPEQILATAQALYEGGVRLLEITFDQSSTTGERDTAKGIRLLCEAFGDSLGIGAGTVMTPAQAQIAIQAGAGYIISPNTDAAVIRATKEQGAVSIPGALTPSEIVAAWQAGADFVKVFPAGTFGIDYIRAIRSPISHIPLLAVGGIDENNLNDYLDAGVCGVGIGSNLVNLKLVREGRFDDLAQLARRFRVRPKV